MLATLFYLTLVLLSNEAPEAGFDKIREVTGTTWVSVMDLRLFLAM
ncbi:hypothetical protein JNUCC1_00904 [Lentibacillus sp. JNUCC-1]|nr:hypothetical protein [Lentibacillus sp. JNUCC-1]MUV37098.1 hypothetical protein [Lentibacillus sp. JNUCC-1]